MMQRKISKKYLRSLIMQRNRILQFLYDVYPLFIGMIIGSALGWYLGLYIAYNAVRFRYG
jgi:ABC-type lipoprotein release transport system permease subunit